MKKDPSVFTRVYVLLVVISIWGCAIGARLFFLHVVRAADYKQRAERQQQRAFDVTPSRGVIYDRHKNELAISIKVDSVFAVPEDIEHPAATAKILSKIVGLSADDLLKKFQTQRSFVWIKRKLSEAESAAIQRAKLAGIYFQKEDRRVYPKRELAAHVMGYVNVDEEGMGGLE